MKKKIPKFENEDQEREFWGSRDSTDYIDWEKAKRIKFPNLKPSTKTISIRPARIDDREPQDAREQERRALPILAEDLPRGAYKAGTWVAAGAPCPIIAHINPAMAPKWSYS